MVRRKDRPAPETILPGYRDIAEIGGGAFATVYRATESDTGREVALKILKVDTVHPHLMETFTQEIQALAKVSDHPNIVTLYRPLATPDGRPVLVLELCRESLAQQVRRAGPVKASEVTRIGIKIAGALETAHRHGFLHRDMKPQNILVSQFGEPVLGDFGVAALQASAQATAGVFGFTTLHAAPEILEGHHLSAATDIYGLASTMYQLLTGLAPFATFDNEAPASVILRIIRDPVRPLRSDDIPIGLSDLLEAALAKDPDGRPATGVEFADALVAVEALAGWPPTSYVAWGRDEVAVVAPRAPAPPVPPAAGPPAAGPPAAGPTSLAARAPSLAMPDVTAARPTLPIPDRTAGTPPPITAPPPPPPPAARQGPSVATPAGAARHVIKPDEAGRGPARLPLTEEDRPALAPLRPPPGSEAPAQPAARPVFVDPPAPSEPAAPAPAAYRESIYEQTILPTTGLGNGSGPDAPPQTPVQQLLGSPLLLGGIAAAGLVIVAAVLLVVGVF